MAACGRPAGGAPRTRRVASLTVTPRRTPRHVRHRRAAGRIRQGTRCLPLWATIARCEGAAVLPSSAGLAWAGQEIQPAGMSSNTSQAKALSVLHRAKVADYAEWSLFVTCRPCDAPWTVPLAALPPDLPRPCRSRDHGQQPAGMARPGGAGVGTGELRLRRGGRRHATDCQGASERFGQAGLLEHGIRRVPADDALRNRELRLRDRGEPKFMAALGGPDEGAAGIP